MTPTPAKIADLLRKRDVLLTRRDGLYDSARVDRIDAQLNEVPAGQNNEVDKALGRPCARIAARVVTCIERHYIAAQAVTVDEEEVKAAAQKIMDSYHTEMRESRNEWIEMRGNCDI